MNAISETTAASPVPEPVHSWRARLAETWPDAVRLLAGAMLAYLIARLLQLHEAHWAVLTALVTSRGHAGGTARAGVERLIATIAGAGIAIGAAWLRHTWQVDSGLILFVALAPLCFLVAVKPNYRGAPVAALIVLSAGPAAGLGPLATAALRTGEIAIGAVAAMLVSAIVFPSRSKAKPRAHAAAVLYLLARWMDMLFAEAEVDARRVEHWRDEIKHELRELTILAHTSGWRKMQDRELVFLLKTTSALNADVGFLARAIARKPLAPVVAELHESVGVAAQALISAIERTASALRSNTSMPDREAIDEALKQLSLAGRDAAERVEPRYTQILIYLLRTVSMGLGNVAASVSLLPSGEGAEGG